MIRGIGYKKVDLSEEEYIYYEQLVKQHSDDTINGAQHFIDLFDVDDNGIITVIKPENNIPWVILFFVQNVMINQHTKRNENRITALEKRLEY